MLRSMIQRFLLRRSTRPSWGGRPVPVRTVRSNQNHAVTPQPFAQRIAVVLLVGNHPRGLLRSKRMRGLYLEIVPLRSEMTEKSSSANCIAACSPCSLEMP